MEKTDYQVLIFSRNLNSYILINESYEKQRNGLLQTSGIDDGLQLDDDKIEKVFIFKK